MQQEHVQFRPIVNSNYFIVLSPGDFLSALDKDCVNILIQVCHDDSHSEVYFLYKLAISRSEKTHNSCVCVYSHVSI